MLLDLKIKTAIERKSSGYRIYHNDGEPEIIEAETVAEAIEKTSIKKPTKIEKIGIIKKSLFSEDELKQIDEADLQSKNSDTENILVEGEKPDEIAAGNNETAEPLPAETKGESNTDISV